ncbi:MAG: PAS domain S-box protein, partial [Verrucomicrobiae bacterium]|nr:PAS domain S-box protein [Verrucomicrobiae bacterium]
MRRLADRIRSLKAELEDVKKSMDMARIAESVLESARVAIVVLDPAARVIIANPTFRNLCKLSQEEIRDKAFFELRDGLFDVPELRELVNRLQEPTASAAQVEFEYEVPELGTRLTSVNAHRIPGAADSQTLLVLVIDDITDRVRSRRQLEMSEQRLRATLENAQHLAIQWYDEEGRVQYWNPASEELYGWKAEEVIGKTLDQLIFTPEQAESFRTMLREIGRTTKPSPQFVSAIRKRDGTTGWVNSSVFPIPVGEERTWFVCMDVDITEQVLTTSALRASEERFRKLAEHSVAGIYVHDGSKVLYVNQTFAEIFGYTTDEMLSSVNPLDLVAETDRERVADSVKKRINGLVRTVHHTWHGIHKSGRIIVVESFGTQVEWDGKPAVLGTMLDVTERAKVHEEIARAAREWEATFEATNDAIWVMDKNRVVLRANQTTRSLLGIEASELVGKRCYEAVHHLAHTPPNCMFDAALSTQQRQSREIQIEDRWFEVVCDPVVDELGESIGVVHIIADITQRKNAEREMV